MSKRLRPTHAGGLVYRMHGGIAKYLVTVASDGTGQWVLPKGHIEPGESTAEAAAREVAEETGVAAEVVESIGDVAFEVDGTPLSVRFYLMREAGEVASGEQRTIEWLTASEAERRLSHAESREVLREGHTAASRLEIADSPDRRTR